MKAEYNVAILLC